MLHDYDTSSDRFVELFAHTPPVPALAKKLLRWDAVYFVHAAQGNGKVYEQEWAFGIGFSSVVRGIITLIARTTGVRMGEVVVAIGLAHGMHLVAVLALYQLTLILLSAGTSTARSVYGYTPPALGAALLHVISPAGIFLSAPYAESSFAALSFMGACLFVRAGRFPTSSASRSLHVLAAGLVFGVSATFRSNGILSGLLFASEAIYTLIGVLQSENMLHCWRKLLDVVILCIGGLELAGGFAYPQILAWTRYCSNDMETTRPQWCDYTIPSIYSHVQATYWYVAFEHDL